MNTIAAASLIVVGLFVSAPAHADEAFHINAPTKADTAIRTHRESIWAQEDKNPVQEFFAKLFESKPTSESEVEMKAEEINQPKQQHIASAGLSD